MTAALSTAILASETTIDTGAPPIAWGLGAFALFMALLLMTLAFGRGRG